MTSSDDFAKDAPKTEISETDNTLTSKPKNRRTGKSGFMSNTRIGVRIAMIVALPLKLSMHCWSGFRQEHPIPHAPCSTWSPTALQ